MLGLAFQRADPFLFQGKVSEVKIFLENGTERVTGQDLRVSLDIDGVDESHVNLVGDGIIHEKDHCVIRVEISNHLGYVTLRAAAPGVRAAEMKLKIVRLKLVIERAPAEYYKDAGGGRRNNINLRVRLVDSDNRVDDSEAELRFDVELRDAIDSQLIDAGRLELLDERNAIMTRHEICLRKGLGTVKFKILQTSRSNQRRPYSVWIVPASNQLRSGIMHASTNGITVYSKQSSPSSEGSVNSSEETASTVDDRAYGTLEPSCDPIHCARKICNTLNSIRWHVIGYQENSDGTPNYDQPVYSRENPNKKIEEVLECCEHLMKEQGALKTNGTHATTRKRQVDIVRDNATHANTRTQPEFALSQEDIVALPETPPSNTRLRKQDATSIKYNRSKKRKGVLPPDVSESTSVDALQLLGDDSSIEAPEQMGHSIISKGGESEISGVSPLDAENLLLAEQTASLHEYSSFESTSPSEDAASIEGSENDYNSLLGEAEEMALLGDSSLLLDDMISETLLHMNDETRIEDTKTKNPNETLQFDANKISRVLDFDADQTRVGGKASSETLLRMDDETRIEDIKTKKPNETLQFDANKISHVPHLDADETRVGGKASSETLLHMNDETRIEDIKTKNPNETLQFDANKISRVLRFDADETRVGGKASSERLLRMDDETRIEDIKTKKPNETLQFDANKISRVLRFDADETRFEGKASSEIPVEDTTSVEDNMTKKVNEILQFDVEKTLTAHLRKLFVDESSSAARLWMKDATSSSGNESKRQESILQFDADEMECASALTLLEVRASSEMRPRINVATSIEGDESEKENILRFDFDGMMSADRLMLLEKGKSAAAFLRMVEATNIKENGKHPRRRKLKKPFGASNLCPEEN